MDVDLFSRKDKTYFKIANEISRLSDYRVQIGCVIVNQHKIISSGHNSNSKCHPIQRRLDEKEFKCCCEGKLHAESDAIIYCMRNHIDLNNATLYVYREHKDGSKAMARPCSRCMRLIKQNGIRKIKYTTNDGIAAEYIDREENK